MVEVLNQVFPEGVAVNIQDYAAPYIEWEAVYGSLVIYRTKHILTYGGGPEGGYVYFYREREPGWYSWRRDWFRPPVYTKLDGQVAIWWDENVERIGVVPHDYEPPEGEDITIMSEELMEEIPEVEDP